MLRWHTSGSSPFASLLRQHVQRASCVRCWAGPPSFSSVRSKKTLSWDETLFASKLAKWSGYCYYPADQLPKLVEAEGLQLVASGRTSYTSWYIADGAVDYSSFHQAACDALAPTRKAMAMRHAPKPAHHATGFAQPNTQHHNQDSKHHPTTQHQHQPRQHQQHPHNQHAGPGNNSTHPSVADDPGIPLPKSTRHRFVFIRGVQWSAHDINITALSSALMNFWPSALPTSTDSTEPANSQAVTAPPLVCHTGVAQLAADLYKQLHPYLTDSRPPQQGNPANSQQREGPSPTAAAAPGSKAQGSGGSSTATRSSPASVCIAGHSLGGALGMLVLAQSVSLGHRSPHSVSCHTFGSPPVLAHRDGGGGHRVLQVLGLDDASVRSFVLEHDPVPRALLTADPAFNTLRSYGPVKQLLDVRGWINTQQQRAQEVRHQLDNVTSMVSGFLSQAWGSATGASPGTAATPAVSTPAPEVVVPVLTPERFVFENVGSVYLMRGGAELVPVAAAAEVEELLRMVAVDFVSQPARAVQAWLDHHHNSYAHDLEIASLAELKRQLRQSHLKQIQQQTHQAQHALLQAAQHKPAQQALHQAPLPVQPLAHHPKAPEAAQHAQHQMARSRQPPQQH